MTTLEEQFAKALQLRHTYERQLAGNVAWIQAGEFWLDRQRLLCEARAAVHPPEIPRPVLANLASAELRLAYADELNAHLLHLLEYQREIMQAQYATAYNHGLDGQFVEYRAAQATRVDDWLWYEPNTEGMDAPQGRVALQEGGTP